jgi:hypothetical protein
MFVYKPEDILFIERVGKHEAWKFNLQGEWEARDIQPTLVSLCLKADDNFYTHYQDTIKYWTVGADKLIMINEFKALIPNEGFHGVHDRFVSRSDK